MSDLAMSDLEADIRQLGLRLHARARRPGLLRGLSGRLLARVARDDGWRDSLFPLIEALPQLRDAGAIAAHLRAGLPAARRADWLDALLRLAARPGLAWSVRVFTRRLALHFLCEENEKALRGVLAGLARVPARATLDAVGEQVLSEAEADQYLDRNLRLLEWMGTMARPHGPPHLSLKLSALTPRFDPLDPGGTRHRVLGRMAPLIDAASRLGATLTVDMEHYALKEAILDLFLHLAEACPGAWQPAIALQAYLRDTGDDLVRVHATARRLGRRLGVRLVKGAYWDQEQAWAAQRGWPVPAWTDKAATDAAFEAHTVWLLERSDCLHPAIASHNLRSQALALTHARRLGIADTDWEMQMLFGMAEPLRDALAGEGAPLRIYVPTGALDTGIAYLIRRLMENTASTSVLRQSYLDGVDAESLLQTPHPPPVRESAALPAPAKTFANLPLLDFSQAGERDRFAGALRSVRARLPLRHAGFSGRHLARNPAAPEEVLGEVGLALPEDADIAVARARAAFPAWRDTPASERCARLRRAAALLAARRHELAALAVLETAKPWREADADVAEAVDFLGYYAGQMEILDGWNDTHNFPGEDNAWRYEPRGVAVVIAPWNFPYALLCGMTSAALAAGNCVVMKPALPALLTAHALRDVLHEAGIPFDVLQLLPGDADVGEALVCHAGVQVVAFTGSRQTGLAILRAAHTPAPEQRHVKQVVCEMGGKNAIVVDADADPDEAVAGILASAFGYSGQKCSACSRVIVVEPVHDALLSRLAAAADALVWGPPEDPACDHGPLISAAARDKALSYIEIGRQEGRMVWQGWVPGAEKGGGWYVSPTIFADIRPHHRLAREEVFGPVLAVMRAPDFATALEMALDSDYALTGGVYSRLPAHLALARARFAVGNLYLNRPITGARVGIQSFGGVALSGTGIQAGGPDYLKQFLWSRCVSVNTMRHGFMPSVSAP